MPKKLINPILILALAIASGFAIFYATTWGPWAYRDSTAFVEAGRNLASGDGLVILQASGDVEPYIKQPPLYPLMLASGITFGTSAVNVGRWIDILSMMGLVGLAGWGLRKVGLATWQRIPILLIVIATPVIFEDYTSLLTEPPYLTFGIAALFLLAIYLAEGRRHQLLLSALAAALCALTRYAGAVVIVSAAAALFLLGQPRSWKKRFAEILTYGLISGLPVTIWTVLQFARAGQSSSMPAATASAWNRLEPLRANLVDLIWDWLPFTWRMAPTTYRMRLVALGLLFALVSVLVVALVRRKRQGGVLAPPHPASLLSMVMIATAFTHILFLTAVTLIGPWVVRIDIRQLSPVFLFGPLGILIIVFRAMEVFLSSRTGRATATMAMVLFLASSLPRTAQFVETLHQEGRGYASERWLSMAIFSDIEAIPENISLISNEPEAINFFTARPAYLLPELQSGTPSPLEETFGDDLDDGLQARFRRGEAALVLFTSAQNRLLPLYGDKTEERAVHLVDGLDVQYERWDGAIYWFNPDHP